MKIATLEDVDDAINELRHIRGDGASTSLVEMFIAINSSPFTRLNQARVAYSNVGFVLYTPHVDTRYRLVAYVREKSRLKGFGRALAEEALIKVPFTERRSLARFVWQGSESAYRFWLSCGIPALHELGAEERKVPSPLAG